MLDRSFINDYENGAARVRLAIQGLARADLFALPVAGTWSIQQIVIHLADSEMVFADRFKRVIAEENARLLAFDENAWMKNLHVEAQSAEEAALAVELTRKQLGRVLHALADSTFERTGVHSTAGPLTLKQIVEKATSHLEHHLKFLVEKRAMLGKNL